MVVSTLSVVLAACSVGLVISPLTIVLVALILLSRKLIDNNDASAAADCGSNSKDNMNKLP